MLRTRLLSAAAAAAGLVTLSSALVVVPQWPAHADATDGTLTVIVNRDVDQNGAYDSAVDDPQPGIEIVISDAGGERVDGRTDDEGRYVLTGSDTLTGGRYFVVAEIPADLSDLAPVPASDTFSPLSTTVDVSTDSQTVRMGVAAEAGARANAGTGPLRPAAG